VEQLTLIATIAFGSETAAARSSPLRIIQCVQDGFTKSNALYYTS
jgi:hypothetical protein